MGFASSTTGDSGVPLSIGLTREKGQARLSLVGELDVNAVPLLSDRVDDLLALRRRLRTVGPGVRTVALDLTGLTFADVAGARALLVIHQRLAKRYRHVEILGMQHQVRRVLDLTRDGAGPPPGPGKAAGESHPAASEAGPDVTQHRSDVSEPRRPDGGAR